MSLLNSDQSHFYLARAV